jgi:hypothetical protein
VKSVDASAGTATISTVTAAGAKDVLIHVGANTIVRRYAPGSVKFDDAKVSSLTEVKAGDQLRARGTRSADGAEFTADEIVSGSFLNIAGTISSLDANAGTINVSDLISGKPVTVKVSSDSQVRKIPPEIAQRIAARLKGGATPAAAGTSAGGTGATGGANPPASAQSSPTAPGMGGGAGAGARPGGGGGDMQQMLSRLPASKLSDFQKGDAVMLVATSDQGGTVNAITVLGGVEPLLQASPNGQAASILTPWSLSSGGGGGDEGGGRQ